MPKFIIERNYPGAGQLSQEDLTSVSQKSCAIIQQLTGVEWVESFVTDNKIYCVYNAPDETAIRDHSERGGFPCDSVAQVKAVFGPITAKLDPNKLDKDR